MFKHPFCGNEPEKSMENKRFFGIQVAPQAEHRFEPHPRFPAQKWQPPDFKANQPTWPMTEDIQDMHFFKCIHTFCLKKTQFPWLCRLQSLSHLPPRLKKYCTYDTNDLIQQLKHAHQDPLERWRVQNTNSLLLTSLLFSKVNGPDHRGWGLVANIHSWSIVRSCGDPNTVHMLDVAKTRRRRRRMRRRR